LYNEVSAILVPEDDEELVRATREAKVEFASGLSESESIRDFNSGPGLVRYQVRDPYAFRREPCADTSGNYRRRMRPSVYVDGSFRWMAEVESDEEGHVPQKSFVPVTDEMDITLRSMAHERATDEARKLFNMSWATQRALRTEAEARVDVSVDPAILKELLRDFLSDRSSKGIVHALDILIDKVRNGVIGPAVNAVRATHCCGACGDALFTEGEKPALQPCPVCDKWLHKGQKACYHRHVCSHIQGVLCYSHRRATERLQSRQKSEAALSLPRAPTQVGLFLRTPP